MPVDPITGNAQPYTPQLNGSNNQQQSQTRVEGDRDTGRWERPDEAAERRRDRAERSDDDRTRSSEARMTGTKIDLTG